MIRPTVGHTFSRGQKGRLTVRKEFWNCAFLALAGFWTDSAWAQQISPYHAPGAEGVDQSAARNRPRTGFAQGGRFVGGAVESGPSFPSYWTYNRFSNLGFGGLNWYFGPLGGYTPYVSTPYATTTYGYPNFGPYYSYVPLAPVVRQPKNYWTGPNPFDQPVIDEARLEDQLAQRDGPAPRTPAPRTPSSRQRPPQQPLQENVKIFKNQTSPEAQRRSIRYQALGDEWFGKQNYLQAYGHYKQAVSATPKRAEARFRMAMALAATANYASAVDEMKRAMRLDLNWPRHGAQLDELFGGDNNLSKNAVLHKVASWVREDIRDPDRLFLMGVMLHFNDDPDKSRPFFEASMALSANPIYAKAFLEAEIDEQSRQAVEDPIPAPPDDDDHAPPAKKGPEEPKPRPLAKNVPRHLSRGAAIGFSA